MKIQNRYLVLSKSLCGKGPSISTDFIVIFLLTGKISQFKPIFKFTSMIFWGEGGLRALKTTSSIRVIKPKEMKNDKGRVGGPKIGKMGRRRLWMAP